MSASTDLFDLTGRLERISGAQRRDGLLVGAILLCGFGLRAIGLDRTGIEHFDEGAYVFSALGISDAGQLPRLFPNQHLLSPLAYPALVGGVTAVTGLAPDSVAIWISVLFGTLTIPLLFGVVARALGPAAGLAAATLLAFNEYHIALSRAALPDVMFGAGLVLSMGLLGEAVVRRSLGWAAGAGFALALVWHTKYHGWWVLAIAAAAFAADTLFRPDRATLPRSVAWRRQLLLGAAAGGIAVLCYLPWAYSASALPGGYGAVIDHQLGLLELQWFSNVIEHARLQLFLDGPLSRASLPLAFGVACLVSERDSLGVRELAILLGVLTIGTLVLGSTGATLALACASLSGLLYGQMGFRRWLLLIWFVAFLIGTPMVHASARVLLPLLLAAQCLAACMLARAIERAPGMEPTGPAWRLAATVSATTLVAALSFLLADPSNPWRPSDGFRVAAAQMDEAVPSGYRLIVVDEPALAYQFSRSRPTIPKNPSLGDFVSEANPIYLVMGRSPKRASSDALASFGERVSSVHGEHVDPKDLRLLDDMGAVEAARFRSQAEPGYDYELRLLQPDG